MDRNCKLPFLIDKILQYKFLCGILHITPGVIINNICSHFSMDKSILVSRFLS